MYEKQDDNKEYNKKLLFKLIHSYGKDNAKAIYDKMKEEGEEEVRQLIETSKTSNVSFPTEEEQHANLR